MRKKSSAVKVGRKPTARSTENIAAVRDSVGRSPKKSVRRRSQDLGLNKSSVQRILTKDLHLYPYRIQVKQKLTTADKEKRVKMCNWFSDKIEDEPDLSVGISEGSSLQEQPPHHPRAKGSNHSRNQGYTKRRVHQSHRQLRP